MVIEHESCSVYTSLHPFFSIKFENFLYMDFTHEGISPLDSSQRTMWQWSHPRENHTRSLPVHFTGLGLYHPSPNPYCPILPGCHAGNNNLSSRYDSLNFSWALREKRVLKWCPWGTIATNGTLFSKGHSFFLNNHVYEKNSTPLGQGHYS